MTRNDYLTPAEYHEDGATETLLCYACKGWIRAGTPFARTLTGAAGGRFPFHMPDCPSAPIPDLPYQRDRTPTASRRKFPASRRGEGGWE